jgi:hypothetical protein
MANNENTNANVTKVLWFSRHTMTGDQHQALVDRLGECEVRQINKTINSAYELEKEIKESDVIAITAPINLQAQFLKIAAGKPVITAVNKRVLTPSPDGGEDKVEFVFGGWKVIKKIDVVMEDF